MVSPTTTSNSLSSAACELFLFFFLGVSLDSSATSSSVLSVCLRFLFFLGVSLVAPSVSAPSVSGGMLTLSLLLLWCGRRERFLRWRHSRVAVSSWVAVSSSLQYLVIQVDHLIQPHCRGGWEAAGGSIPARKNKLL